MITSGWGRFNKVNSEVFALDPKKKIKENLKIKKNFIAYGSGRSYGDSCLSENIIMTKFLNKEVKIDAKNGEIECSSSATFEEILKKIIPLGWFVPVSPGTKYVTVGGAIASDVHGKNHHKDGSFSDHLISFLILISSGEEIECSKEKNKDLFLATCGGMGLTGIILKAKFKLIKINSTYIDQETIKTKNLKQTIEVFSNYKEFKYVVAWIDTNSKNQNIGRALIYLGAHSNNKKLEIKRKIKLNIGKFIPSFFSNNFFLKLYSNFYYLISKSEKKTVYFDDFFYPLDKVSDWNHFYGKKGFIQIQLLVPKINAHESLFKIISFMQKNSQTSFLSTLKEMGPGNKNFLSFPSSGFTLTMDLKVNDKLLNAYPEFEKILKICNAKVYLTKDSLMTESFFKNSYKFINQFKNIKEKYDPKKIFSSIQSRRLGI